MVATLLDTKEAVVPMVEVEFYTRISICGNTRFETYLLSNIMFNSISSYELLLLLSITIDSLSMFCIVYS